MDQSERCLRLYTATGILNGERAGKLKMPHDEQNQRCGLACRSASFGLSVFKVVEGICLAHWMLQIQKTAEHVSAPQQEMY